MKVEFDSRDLTNLAEELKKMITFEVIMDRPDKLLNKKELAEKLKTKDVDRWIRLPGFPNRKIPEGREYRWSCKAVDKFLEEYYKKQD